MSRVEITTGAPTMRLCSLIAQVLKLKSVTHTLDQRTRMTLWPKIIANTAPTLSVAELRQAALLGYLAVAKVEDRMVFTVTALGRNQVESQSEKKRPVYRAGACPKCGAIAEHWVPAGETKAEVGFWICQSDDLEEDQEHDPPINLQ